MKVQELNEIVEFFHERQGTDEGKAEYYGMLLQAEQIRIMSEIRKGLRGLQESISESADAIIGSIESRLWPLVSLYEMEEPEEQKEQKPEEEGRPDDAG
jgi:uncharacterized protein YheU (UPF0270 family)